MEAQGPEGGWAWEADVANGFVEGVWTRIPPPALNLAGDMADLALADEGEEDLDGGGLEADEVSARDWINDWVRRLRLGARAC